MPFEILQFWDSWSCFLFAVFRKEGYWIKSQLIWKGIQHPIASGVLSPFPFLLFGLDHTIIKLRGCNLMWQSFQVEDRCYLCGICRNFFLLNVTWDRRLRTDSLACFILTHLSCCVGEKADLYSEDDDNLHVCRENIYVYSFVQIIFPLRLSAIEKLANEKLIHELQVSSIVVDFVLKLH